MNTYKIQERETGNVIDTNLDYEQAVARVEFYEVIDDQEGVFTPNFYEIVCE